MVQKYDLAAGPTKLLHQQHLIGIFPCKTVRAEHDHHVHYAVADGVPQCIQGGTIQTRAADALVAENMGVSQDVTLSAYPAS
jgi:hypothetical protein